MNLVKIGQLLAESVDEGFGIIKLLSDGKLTKDEIKALCKDLLEITNTFLKLEGKKLIPMDFAVKLADAIINGYDAYLIIQDYLKEK